MNRYWRAVAPSIKLLGALSAILCTAGLTLQQVDVWKDPPRWALVAMVATVAVIACFSSTTHAWHELHRPLDFQVRIDVAGLLRQAARDIAQTRQLPRDAVGVSAFMVRRSWWPPFDERLERVHRERGNSNPPPSTGIEWTKGKGVIGKCWMEQKPVFKDLKAIAIKHGDCSPECFAGLDKSVTMGLSFEDFRTIVGKYSSVLAMPMHHEGTFIGCIAVDLPLDVGSKTSLDHSTVKEIVAFAAASVGKVLRPAS